MNKKISSCHCLRCKLVRPERGTSVMKVIKVSNICWETGGRSIGSILHCSTDRIKGYHTSVHPIVYVNGLCHLHSTVGLSSNANMGIVLCKHRLKGPVFNE